LFTSFGCPSNASWISMAIRWIPELSDVVLPGSATKLVS
jgi:hypothetical protein